VNEKVVSRIAAVKRGYVSSTSACATSQVSPGRKKGTFIQPTTDMGGISQSDGGDEGLLGTKVRGVR